jgi:hypothetical protein
VIASAAMQDDKPLALAHFRWKISHAHQRQPLANPLRRSQDHQRGIARHGP